MKNLKNITNKAILTTGIVMGILAATTTIAKAETDKKVRNEKKSATKVEIVEAEIAEQMEAEAEFMQDLETFTQEDIKIFDANDQLIYQSNTTGDDIGKDKLLVSLLLKSDFLMQHDNTSYYKLSK